MSTSPFYALLRRAHHLQRWSLMRGARGESVAAHSYDVAVLAHALAVLSNTRFGGVDDVPVNAERAVLLALYHDAAEIFTGDMPTPVKYHSPALRQAYAAVEQEAETRLLNTLPADLREAYASLLTQPQPPDAPEPRIVNDSAECRIVKAADKLAALTKCAEELADGNQEFAAAYAATLNAVQAMNLPAVDMFIEEMLPAFSLPLDAQISDL